jgi:hypothetical protein
MYRLLGAVGVRLPAEVDEQAQARRLLDRLAGVGPVNRFRELHDWLSSFRERVDGLDGPTVLDRAVLALAPHLGRKEAGAYTHHLSFRLHLRACLLRLAQEEDWASDQGDLYSSIMRLDRRRMAMVLEEAALQLAEVWERLRAPLCVEPTPVGA